MEVILEFILHLSFRCVRYKDTRNKLPSTQLVSVVSLINTYQPQLRYYHNVRRIFCSFGRRPYSVLPAMLSQLLA
jgi:hypothetical protein